MGLRLLSGSGINEENHIVSESWINWWFYWCHFVRTILSPTILS